MFNKKSLYKNKKKKALKPNQDQLLTSKQAKGWVRSS
jgi:hypothetical protein